MRPEIMRHSGAVTLLLSFACDPTESFVLPPSSIESQPQHAARFNHRGCCGGMRARPGRRSGAGVLDDVFVRTKDRHGACRHLSRSLPSARAAAAAAGLVDGTGTPVTQLLLKSSEAVSCFRKAETGSDIWLVGCYHRGQPSVELVERVIGTVNPQVVMVELDAQRVGLLPKGEAHKGDDGLCWWTPNQLTTDLKKPETGKRRPGTSGERGEQGVEFHTAAVAAQACGARVLLGDRDLEDILRRQAEARSADEKLAAKPCNKRRRAGLKMEKLEGLIARRSALGQEVAVTREIMRKWSAAMKRLRPREHATSVTERDEIMADNLMRLKGSNIIALAVVGFGHLDGIEKILEAEGWKPVRG